MRFNGPRTTLFWGTDSLPASNAGDEDIALRADEVAPPPNGSWFRIVDYPPGFPGRRHKTDTIDYAICMSGEINMELDDGIMVHMKAGDVLVQRPLHGGTDGGRDGALGLSVDCRMILVGPTLLLHATGVSVAALVLLRGGSRSGVSVEALVGTVGLVTHHAD